MKKLALSSTLACLMIAPLVVAEDEAPSITLMGEYVWDQRGMTGDVEAVFTPTGKGTWEVDFHFTFRGQPHTYTGTAEGSLTEGALKGTVTNEDKRRSFTFEGSVADGSFSGTHAETTPGREYDTGTLTLAGGE